MTVSYFDQMLHEFRCLNPKCGQTFKQPLRSLVYADEVLCPACGTVMDIREAKAHGEIGKDFDTAAELDKQASQKS